MTILKVWRGASNERRLICLNELRVQSMTHFFHSFTHFCVENKCSALLDFVCRTMIIKWIRLSAQQLTQVELNVSINKKNVVKVNFA